MHLKKNLAISDTGYLFNPSTGESFVLNPTGKHIFELLKEGKNPEEITDDLNRNYSADESTIEKDLSDFIHIMRIHQMFENDE